MQKAITIDYCAIVPHRTPCGYRCYQCNEYLTGARNGPQEPANYVSRGDTSFRHAITDKRGDSQPDAAKAVSCTVKTDFTSPGAGVLHA